MPPSAPADLDAKLSTWQAPLLTNRARTRVSRTHLVCTEVDPLGDKLVFEPSGAAERADQLFPHLYGGPMATSAVVDVIDLPWDAAAGKHVFPKDW